MTPDLINGSFEIFGSIMLWFNVSKLYTDKKVMGINLWTPVFFTSWGIWNIYYYPSLNQWFSFIGGISLAIANITWLVLMLYYKFKNKE